MNDHYSRSCSSLGKSPLVDTGTILSNVYISTTGLKNENYRLNYKGNYFTDNKINNKSLKMKFKDSKVNLDHWLSEINMGKYKRLLTKNGYSNRSKLAHISIADLTDMGIKKASEIQILMKNAHQLRNDCLI